MSTSFFFRETNEDPTEDLFNKKLIYNSFLDTAEYPSLVDFQFAEKALYGRVNRQFIPIVASDLVLKLRGSGADGTQTQGIRALNFVMDAFEELRLRFQERAASNSISPNEKYLTNLVIYKGYDSPLKQYNQYVNTYIEAFKDIAKSEDLVFSTFEEFVNKIMPFLKETVRSRPFTYPGFVKSRHCSPYSSGLALAIADEDSANDKVKIEEFVSSPNWYFFISACNEFGFMVDKNEPWRIVADIGSAPMVEYARKYNARSTDAILATGYRYAHDSYLTFFRNMMYTMYRALSKKRYRRETLVNQQGGKVVMQEPVKYTAEDFITQYPDSYFILLYCDLRFIEEETKFDYAEKYQLKDDVMEIYDRQPQKALYAFERIINKTFDYNGSLTYIVKRIAQTRQ